VHVELTIPLNILISAFGAGSHYGMCHHNFMWHAVPWANYSVPFNMRFLARCNMLQLHTAYDHFFCSCTDCRPRETGRRQRTAASLVPAMFTCTAYGPPIAGFVFAGPMVLIPNCNSLAYTEFAKCRSAASEWRC
jgi:hypothetical protein